MKNSPQYRFFRVIKGGELIDIDIFQYPHKTTVIISMLFYKQEQIIMASHTNPDRKTAIKIAQLSFEQSKMMFDKKFNPPPVFN